MFPRELWQIIYHYSYYTTLENLLINKQFYDELSDYRFWLIYTKNKLIKDVEYTKVSDWIKEFKYIDYINIKINQLKISDIYYCQRIVNRGARKGYICGNINCEHADVDKHINKGRILFYLKHINITKIDHLQKYNIPFNSLIYIYNNQSILIENKNSQVYFEVLDKHDFKILLYQLFKN
jgi:hypothetical protein